MTETQLKDDFSVTFDFNVINSSERRIGGVASYESEDREGEIILHKALAEALEGFSQLPVLHLQHTERPAGMVTKSYVDDKGLHIESKIPEHKNWDDIWNRIEKGELGKYSIYGKRVSASPECKLRPNARRSPCITKALDLWSVSIVDYKTAVNQDSYVELVKALKSTQTINNASVEKAQVMTESATIPDEALEAEENPDVEVVKAADYDDRFDNLEKQLSQLVEDIAEIRKSEVTTMTDETPEVQTTPVVEPETIEKASLEGTDEIVKALKPMFDELKGQITELTSRLEKIEDEPITKAAVVIPEQLDAASVTEISPVSNDTGLKTFFGRR